MFWLAVIAGFLLLCSPQTYGAQFFAKVTVKVQPGYYDTAYLRVVALSTSGVVMDSFDWTPPTGVTTTRNLSYNIADGGELSLGRVEIQNAANATIVGQSYVFDPGAENYAVLGPVNLGTDYATRPETTFSVPSNYPLPDGQKTVWANNDSSLTAPLYREGVDKVVAAVMNGSGGSGGGSGSSGSDPAANSDREAVATAIKQANQLTDFNELTPSASKGEMLSAGENARAQMVSLFGSAPTSVGYELNTSGAPLLEIALPVAFGGATFDLNPFQSPRLLTVASWFRTAVAWLAIVLLGKWIWEQLAEWVRGYATIQQAKGNPVVGGTGAQATALAAAGLMTAAIVVAVTSLLAWSFGTMNLPAFVASVTTNPVATIPAGVLWMLDQILPVFTLVSCLVARISFNIYASSLFAGCAAVVRFIVP